MTDNTALREAAINANEELAEALNKANHTHEYPVSIAIALSKVEDAHIRLSEELDEFETPEDGGGE